jgi:hypothetical protein
MSSRRSILADLTSDAPVEGESREAWAKAIQQAYRQAKVGSARGHHVLDDLLGKESAK